MTEKSYKQSRDASFLFAGRFGKHLLSKLLYDHTVRHNISWQTEQYESYGENYEKAGSVKVRFISGEYGGLLQPRVKKTIAEQEQRARDKGEVFTPSWVCNKQNNLIDNRWFGKADTFNKETENGWEPTEDAVQFPEGKSWRDYVLLNRLEVSCGEAPYLTSRYDTVTGNTIPVMERIGLLDRKLRVVTENCGIPAEWKEWALRAVESIYGYDWQGDNVLLARENMLMAVFEAYQYAFCIPLQESDILTFAHVISWNIWQMDGIKCVIPNSCHEVPEPQKKYEQLSLLDPEPVDKKSVRMLPCEGCKSGDIHKHNGVYCRVMDWKTHKSMLFVDMYEEAGR